MIPSAHAIVVSPAAALRGSMTVPGDKSISHRYALLAALAEGRSTLAHYSTGADCASTLSCLAALGVGIETRASDEAGAPPIVIITGRGLGGLQAPPEPLDCGNSGTTMRMLAGVVAAHPFRSTLMGDVSLSRRPMRRVLTPLIEMGAHAEVSPGDRPPIVIVGGPLRGITYTPPVPSAQLKSAVLLAGLQATGETVVMEPAATRDHTERALAAFGAVVRIDGLRITLAGGQRLAAGPRRVPGDVSSAAFFAAAAAAIPGSALEVRDVGLNPSRTGLLAMLQRFGADVDVQVDSVSDGEPIGRLLVRGRGLGALTIAPHEVPDVIDEIPVLAALATAGGEMTVTGAGELRVKESDRITALVSGLRAMGADADEQPDGFHIRGGRRLTGGTVEALDDHRLAMAFAVAALTATGPTTINGAEAAAVSYPAFFADLERLRA